MKSSPLPPRRSESGNVIFFILLGIVLIGLVTAALRHSGLDNATIDDEQLVVNASRVRQYASELERAVTFIMNNGASEVDIRFAHPDAPSDYGNDFTVNAAFQVFSPEGGGADYRRRPSGISDAGHDADPWEFYGSTHMPDVGDNTGGSERPELMAVLPHVSEGFCKKINEMNGYAPAATPPADTGGSQTDCIHSGSTMRFSAVQQYDDSTPNVTDASTFTIKPALQGCVSCTAGGYHFFHVLKAR